MDRLWVHVLGLISIHACPDFEDTEDDLLSSSGKMPVHI